MTLKEKKYDSPLQATITGILGLFKKQDSVGKLSVTDSLQGKKVLITGASSGLGLAVAKQLAALDAEVIMAVRSGIPEKGEEVKRVSGKTNIHMLPVDLSDFDSIHQLVNAVKSKFKQIDILICNAAIVVSEARRTKEGLDEMFMYEQQLQDLELAGLYNNGQVLDLDTYAPLNPNNKIFWYRAETDSVGPNGVVSSGGIVPPGTISTPASIDPNSP